MLFSRPTFIGIDPTAGQRPFVYAALDSNLRLLALGKGGADEVLAFAAGQREAFVAVSAPRRPNQGLMRREDLRRQLSPPPHPGRWLDLRLVEYQLSQHNIRMPQTYGEEERCARWMQMGFNLFRRLESLGYRPCPEEEQVRQSLEVYPYACYTVLLGHAPFPKASLEGRLQRQLILYQHKVEVPDPMRFFEEITSHKLLQGVLPEEELYTAPELDALVAAFTAWTIANHPEQSIVLGNPEEGQLILPVGELKPRY